MSKEKQLDFSRVAPHRRDEVARRIEIIERYVARETSRREAIAQLGLTEVSFWILVRGWLDNGRPEALMGSGKERKKVDSVSDAQRQLISDAEAAARTQSVSQVMERARRLAELRGVGLPGVTTMKTLIGEIRRGRGLRPEGVRDVLVTHCAIDVPVRHAEHGVVAPIAALVLDIRREATVLGMSLSTEAPSSSSAAAALLDALSADYLPQSQALNECRVLVGASGGWSNLEEALQGANLPLYFMPARPRSWREIVGLLGLRPGGIRLKPDLTERLESERVAHVPQGGTSLDLQDADAILRGRFKGSHSPQHEALLANEEEAFRLSSRLRQLTGRSRASAPPYNAKETEERT